MSIAEIRLYNTLTREKEIFHSLKPGWVSLYSCGPTVYQAAHIGNLKTYLFVDILKRALEYNGYRVKHIMNITDVGHLTSDADTGVDKVEAAAEKEHKTAKEITKHYADLFQKDLTALNIEMPTKFAWASQYIKDQIKLVQELEKKGYTYKTDDGIYFDTAKFPEYGKLSKVGTGQARVCHSGEKHSEADFALWKFSKPEEKRQQEWSSPWGVGYPGWHLECSAISTKELGQPFDIHTGGEDHIAIHHNNEIAQSEAAYGKPLANYWLHSMFLLINAAKMAKSEGNFITLPDLIAEGYDPLVFRYLVVSSHYRNKLNFSKEAMDGAQNSLNKLRGLFDARARGGHLLEHQRKAFMLALGDDLNMPEAIKVVWEVVKSNEDLADKQVTILDFDRVLGLGLKAYHPPVVPREIINLANQREKARERKDWDKSDELRKQIEEKGYQILDTDFGYTLKPK
ncbi:MAG: cysteine--tRNA ligase [Patescibacteria group bacterium]